MNPGIDPISGGAGWIGAGLLGLVLAWLLLKHLPEKDRQVERLVQACDAEVRTIVDKFDGAIRDGRTEFRDILNAMNTIHDRHVAALMTAIRDEFKDIRSEGKRQL